MGKRLKLYMTFGYCLRNRNSLFPKMCFLSHLPGQLQSSELETTIPKVLSISLVLGTCSPSSLDEDFLSLKCLMLILGTICERIRFLHEKHHHPKKIVNSQKMAARTWPKTQMHF
jgi:hypothetical protein